MRHPSQNIHVTSFTLAPAARVTCALLVLFLLLVVVGCSTGKARISQGYDRVHVKREIPQYSGAPAVIEHETRESFWSTAQVEAEPGAIEAATATMPSYKSEAVTFGVPAQGSASTGARDAIDQALAQLSFWTWIGLAMVLGGIAYTWAIFAVPALSRWPRWGSPLLILGGLLVGSWPLLLDRYSGWIVGSVGGSIIIGAMVWVSTRHNAKVEAKKVLTTTTETIEKSGDKVKKTTTKTASGGLEIRAEEVLPGGAQV